MAFSTWEAGNCTWVLSALVLQVRQPCRDGCPGRQQLSAFWCRWGKRAESECQHCKRHNGSNWGHAGRFLEPLHSYSKWGVQALSFILPVSCFFESCHLASGINGNVSPYRKCISGWRQTDSISQTFGVPSSSPHAFLNYTEDLILLSKIIPADHYVKMNLVHPKFPPCQSSCDQIVGIS